MMRPRVSIILPTYNEEAVVVQALESLRHVRGDIQVIVVDGASTDATLALVEALAPDYPHPLRVMACERNRAHQLNQAAKLAQGDVLLFLHADALLPREAIEALETALENESVVGGNLQLVYVGDGGWSRFFTWVNRLRRSFGIYYGDSGLFVRRAVFEDLGGFKPIPIMDDYEFVRRMERYGHTVCLAPTLSVSDRRWRQKGVVRTLLIWVWIQTLYSLGVPPRYLARWYNPVRDESETRPAPASVAGVKSS